jgi:hypothetical protein
MNTKRIGMNTDEGVFLHPGPTGRPACASDTYTLITTRLVYVVKVIRRELRQSPVMEVSQIRIPFLGYTTSLFPRPADRHQ